ncbi:hypothetical protein C0995_004546 [Termitomyces sp. Mi166|nr:hypothetical protein C0995_004546 [Termitomyces sp. Mi166\
MDPLPKRQTDGVYPGLVQSPDNFFDVKIVNYGAQPMACGQPYVGPSHTAMQPFVATQVSAYRPTVEFGGQIPQGTGVSCDQPYGGGRSFEPFSPYGVNALYQQTTELDVAAGLSAVNVTAYSRISGYSEDLNNSTLDVTYGNVTGEDVSYNATVHAARVQGADAVNFNRLSNFLAVQQGLWTATGQVMI